ncbi:hypothetical protein PybrP1_004082 [[Pythium] brassicae (nom. inval.)]|nr:hypothetical protein PybrP1_004082 [[Pythium] brassicae (nom. inval.)]
MENFVNFSEASAAYFRSFNTLGVTGLILSILSIMVPFSFFLIIPILMCLRVDEYVSWNWAVVFIPVWFLKYLLHFELQVFIVLKLNKDVDWSVIQMLGPYFGYYGLSFIEVLLGGLVSYRALTKESDSAGVSATEAIKKQRRQLVATVVGQLLPIASHLAQGVMLALKLDHKLGDASWWLVFLPVWLSLGYAMWLPINQYRRARAKSRDISPADPTLPNDDEGGASKYSLSTAVCTIISLAAFASPYFILTWRLEGGSFLAFYVLLPWLIIVGLTPCFICCGSLCVGSDKEKEQVPEVRNPTGDEGAGITTEYVEVEVKSVE